VADDDLSLEEIDDEPLEPDSGKPLARPAKAKGEPGFFARLLGKITAPFAALRFPGLLGPKAIAVVIAVALAVWLLAANAAPVRIVFFFWPVDMPKYVAFILDVALGGLLMWLWLRPRAAKKPAEGEGAK
jgi:hypothetical protein